MTPPVPQPDDHAPRLGLVRIHVWVGSVSACVCIFGYLMGTRMGGFGPSLFWVGLFVAATAFAISTVLARLRPDQQKTLEPPFAGLGAGLQVAVLALATLELVSWMKFPAREIMWVNPTELQGLQRPHPQLGWAPSRNFVSKLDFAKEAVEVKLNSHGFRDIEQETDPNRPRVVIIGDSYPVGWGSRYEHSLTPRLRAVLPEAQVFNASWAGFAKDQIALSYSVLARPLKPDVVLVMFMVRPGVDDSLPLYRGLRKPWFILRDGKLEMKGLPIEFVTTAESNQALYRAWEADRVTGPLAAFRFLTHEFPRRYSATGRRLLPDFDWRQINRVGLPELNAVESVILSDLKRQIEADGAKMIVGIAPGPEIYRGCKDPAKAMATHIASYPDDIDPIDITPRVADDWEQCHNQEFHPNAKGIDRIRDALADRIRTALRQLHKLK